MLGNYNKNGIFTRDMKYIASAVISCIHNDFEYQKLIQDFVSAQKEYPGCFPAVVLVSTKYIPNNIETGGILSFYESFSYLISIASLIPENTNFLLVMPATDSNIELSNHIIKDKQAFCLYDDSETFSSHEYMKDVKIIPLSLVKPEYCHITAGSDDIAVFENVPKFTPDNFVDFSYYDDFYELSTFYLTDAVEAMFQAFHTRLQIRSAVSAKIAAFSDKLFDLSLGQQKFSQDEYLRISKERYKVIGESNSSKIIKTDADIELKNRLDHSKRYMHKMFRLVPHTETQNKCLEDIYKMAKLYRELTQIWTYVINGSKSSTSSIQQSMSTLKVIDEIKQLAYESGSDPTQHLIMYAKERGIDIMIDSLMLGVPIEDIVS